MTNGPNSPMHWPTDEEVKEETIKEDPKQTREEHFRSNVFPLFDSLISRIARKRCMKVIEHFTKKSQR